MDKLWTGAQLRRIRTLAGMSLEEVAAAIRVSRPTLSSWELGLASPSPDKLARLARCYSMAPEELAAYIDYPLSGQVARTLKDWYAAVRDFAHTTSPQSAFSGQDDGGYRGSGDGSGERTPPVSQNWRLAVAGASHPSPA